MKDCLFLVADKDMEFTLKGLLTRGISIGIRDISYDVNVHQQHDPGCRKTGTDLLRNFSKQYKHCFLLFDFEGSGELELSAEELEVKLESELNSFGWSNNNAHVLVINPELENWVWVQSQHLADLLELNNSDDIQNWLSKQNYNILDNQKPERPKEAFEYRLEQIKEPRSSSLYRELASKVSFKTCTDRTFLKLINILKHHFSFSS
jgi:hypothetical protein